MTIFNDKNHKYKRIGFAVITSAVLAGCNVQVTELDPLNDDNELVVSEYPGMIAYSGYASAIVNDADGVGPESWWHCEHRSPVAGAPFNEYSNRFSLMRNGTGISYEFTSRERLSVSPYSDVTWRVIELTALDSQFAPHFEMDNGTDVLFYRDLQMLAANRFVASHDLLDGSVDEQPSSLVDCRAFFDVMGRDEIPLASIDYASGESVDTMRGHWWCPRTLESDVPSINFALSLDDSGRVQLGDQEPMSITGTKPMQLS